MPKVTVNGIELYYELAGSGFPLVHLHGSGSGLRNFARVSPLLTADFSVIDYDMRGFGASDAPLGPYSVEQWADDIAGLLDALSIDEAHVHGTSMGGLVALAFAARHPGRVARLVLSCTLARYDLAAVMNKRVWRAVIEAYGNGEVFLDLMVGQVFSRRFVESADYPAARALVRQLLPDQAPEIARAIGQAIERADLVPSLPRIAARTLVLAGSDDVLTPMDMGPTGAGTRALVDGIPNSRLELLDSGHLLLVERPHESVAAIRAFLTAD